MIKGYTAWKNNKAMIASLKQMYYSVSELAALSTLEAYAQEWDGKNPQISKC